MLMTQGTKRAAEDGEEDGRCSPGTLQKKVMCAHQRSKTPGRG